MTTLQLSREQLYRQFIEVRTELGRAREEVRTLNGRISRLEEQVFDWIADVRRGLLTLEELYERTLA
jgi:hypothetical protein